MMHGMYNAAMNEEMPRPRRTDEPLIEQQVAQPVEPVTVGEPVVEAPPAEEEKSDAVLAEEPFTIEGGKKRATDAVDRVKQAGKEFSQDITTRPLLDAVGSYFTRGIDALISLAEGLERKPRGRK